MPVAATGFGVLGTVIPVAATGFGVLGMVSPVAAVGIGAGRSVIAAEAEADDGVLPVAVPAMLIFGMGADGIAEEADVEAGGVDAVAVIGPISTFGTGALAIWEAAVDGVLPWEDSAATLTGPSPKLGSVPKVGSAICCWMGLSEVAVTGGDV